MGMVPRYVSVMVPSAAEDSAGLLAVTDASFVTSLASFCGWPHEQMRMVKNVATGMLIVFTIDAVSFEVIQIVQSNDGKGSCHLWQVSEYISFS